MLRKYILGALFVALLGTASWGAPSAATLEKLRAIDPSERSEAVRNLLEEETDKNALAGRMLEMIKKDPADSVKEICLAVLARIADRLDAASSKSCAQALAALRKESKAETQLAILDILLGPLSAVSPLTQDQIFSELDALVNDPSPEVGAAAYIQLLTHEDNAVAQAEAVRLYRKSPQAFELKFLLSAAPSSDSLRSAIRPEISASLQSQDAEIRLLGVRALSGISSGRGNLSLLLPLLNDKSAAVAGAAGQICYPAMDELGPVRAVLIRLLKSEDAEVLAQAVELLSTMEADAATLAPDVREALKDPKRRAILAPSLLRSRGYAQYCVPYLEDLLKNPESRGAVLQSLKTVGQAGQHLRPILVKMLKTEKDPGTQLELCEAIQSYGSDPSVAPVLLKATQSAESSSAAWSLIEHEPEIKLETLLNCLQKRFSMNGFQEVSRRGARASALAELLGKAAVSSDKEMRSEVVAAIGTMQLNDAGYVTVLQLLSKDPEGQIRLQALSALFQMTGNPSYMEQALPALQDPKLRDEALMVFMQGRALPIALRPRVREAFARLILSDSLDPNYISLAFSPYKSAGGEVGPILTIILKHLPETSSCLGEMGSDEVAAALQPAQIPLLQAALDASLSESEDDRYDNHREVFKAICKVLEASPSLALTCLPTLERASNYHDKAIQRQARALIARLPKGSVN